MMPPKKRLSPPWTIGALLVLVLSLAAPPLAAAEPTWRGSGRAAGRVLDAEGNPLNRATVTLRMEGRPDGGPAPVTTNAKGRWRIQGLAAGSWRLRVEAEGHLASHGRIVVPAQGPARSVEVRLRSLSEVAPSASEGNPNTIVEWLERGNTLLAQGHYARAREEYGKALRELPATEHPQILRAMAQSFYLEGRLEETALTLRRAVTLAPDDEMLRTLLRDVHGRLGRDAKGREFLDAVDRGEVHPAADPEPPSFDTPRYPERPLLPPAPHRTGRYKTRFERAGSSVSALEEFARRYGVTLETILAEDPSAADLDLAGETFEVYVPPSYGDGAKDGGFGLFVWVSPVPFGGTEREETRRLLDEKRVIWIGANRSGNRRPRWDRFALAVEAAMQMQGLYRIDPRRVWVGGYSGGGRMASGLALLYPDVFRGGFFFYGVDHYLDMPVPDRPGAKWPAVFRKPPSLGRLKRSQRLVVLTGELDFNRSQCRATFESWRREGFDHLTFLEIPGADHYHGVDPGYLRRGFDALDGRDAADDR